MPGYSGASQDPAKLRQEAINIGFPVLIKAAAGGGGRGMRVVHNEADLPSEIERAKSEALRGFKDDRVLVEKFITQAKHIEIQIVADHHGNVAHLWERECSVQRRHQKVIEESPSPFLQDPQNAHLLDTMTTAALEIAKLINYRNLGTVEFVVDVLERKSYFLEVNTRIQVEHPVTEGITGLDLVELGIRIAEGKKLSEIVPSIAQHDGKLTIPRLPTHTIQLRLYAESPASNFVPVSGNILAFQIPTTAQRFAFAPTGISLRVDSHIPTQGPSPLSLDFDPMIAKVLVRADTRAQAISIIASALKRLVCLGLGDTNASLLLGILGHKDFATGNTAKVTTRWCEDTVKELLQSDASSALLDMAALTTAWAWHLRKERQAQLAKMDTHPRANGPWSSPSLNGWRNVGRKEAADRSRHVVQLSIPPQDPLDVMIEYDVLNDSDSFDMSIWSIDNSVLGEDSDNKKLTPDQKMAISRSRLAKSFYQNRQPGQLDAKAKKQEIVHKRVNIKKISSHTDNMVLAGELSHRSLATHFAELQCRIDNQVQTVFIASHDASPDIRYPSAVKLRSYIYAPESGVTSTMISTSQSVLTYYAALSDSTSTGDADSLSPYTTPMPCRILKVIATSGATVKKGDPILIMESMKTEVTLLSRHDGEMSIFVKEGDVVSAGKSLCKVE